MVRYLPNAGYLVKIDSNIRSIQSFLSISGPPSNAAHSVRQDYPGSLYFHADGGALPAGHPRDWEAIVLLLDPGYRLNRDFPGLMTISGGGRV